MNKKKFNLDDLDDIHQYWHDLRKEINILSKSTRDDFVIGWAAFVYNGQSDIIFVYDRLESSAYQDMVQTNLLYFAKKTLMNQ